MLVLTIDWTLFLPGVLLLLIPADLLLSSRVQLRTLESFNNLDNSRRYRRWWWVPALWLDPLRAYAGAMLTRSGLDLAGAYWGVVPGGDYALWVGLMAVAVLIQLPSRREAGVILAPLGFLVGLMASLLPWSTALVGAIAGFTAMFGLRHFGAFFFVSSIAVIFLGVAFRVDLMWVVPAASYFLLPLMVCLVFGQTLELPTRDASNAAGRMS